MKKIIFFIFFLGVIIMSNIWGQEVKLILETNNDILICDQEIRFSVIVRNNSDMYYDIFSGFFFSAINRLEIEYIDAFNNRQKIKHSVFLSRTTKNFQKIRIEPHEEKKASATAIFARGENYVTDLLERNYNGYILDFGIKGIVFLIPPEAEKLIVSTQWKLENQVFESNKIELIIQKLEVSEN